MLPTDEIILTIVVSCGFQYRSASVKIDTGMACVSGDPYRFACAEAEGLLDRGAAPFLADGTSEGQPVSVVLIATVSRGQKAVSRAMPVDFGYARMVKQSAVALEFGHMIPSAIAELQEEDG